MYALDIETESADDLMPYALEPFRAKTNEARITCMSVAGSDGSFVFIQNMEQLKDTLISLKGKEVFAHNAMFDIAWCLALTDISVIKDIKWRDTLLLDKWVTNSAGINQYKSRALSELVKEYLPDHPLLEEFVNVKYNMEDNYEYWKRRNYLDAILTLALAKELKSKLPESSRLGYMVEQSCLAPLAEAWLEGVHVDYDEVERVSDKYNDKVLAAIDLVGVSEEVIRSPKKLGDLLFNEWGLPPAGVSKKTGAPSVSAEILAEIAFRTKDSRLALIRSIKSDLTIMSKYIKGFKKAKEHLKSDTIHGAPRLFGTKTGRMTYASKTKKKFPVSISMHQLPRKDVGIKQCLVAPEGYGIIYLDAAAQELRWIADRAVEKTMIQNFKDGIDLHSFLTERIYGTPYADLVEANKTGGPISLLEQRNAGKLTGLSCQYRIGANSLAKKFLTSYDTPVDIRTANHYLTSYKKTYKDLTLFWTDAIIKTRRNRYAETIGGRRLYIDKLDWAGEQDSINFPIQGSGGDHTEAIMALISKSFHHIRLLVQVHDSLTYLCPIESIQETALDLKSFVNNYDLQNIWGKPLLLDFPWDFAIGPNFKDLKSI